MRHLRRDQGFSIAEMLMALAIMAILAAIVIPTALNQKHSAVETDMRADLLVDSIAIEKLLTDWRGLPPSQVTISTTGGTWEALPAGQGSAAAHGNVLTGGNLTGTIWTDGSYCLQITHADTTAVLNFRSDNQQITDGQCPGSALGGTGSLPGSSPVDLPAAPTSVAADSPSDNTVTVAWDAVSQATSYTVVLSGIASREVNSGTTTTFTGVQPGTVTATVYARNANGTGPGVSTSVSVPGTIIVNRHLHPVSDIVGLDQYPKGKIGSATSAALWQSSAATLSDVTGLTATFVAETGRLYRVSFTVPQADLGTADGVEVAIAVNGATVQDYKFARAATTTPQGLTGWTTVTGSGTTTITVRGARVGNAGTVSFPANTAATQRLLIEDVGLA